MHDQRLLQGVVCLILAASVLAGCGGVGGGGAKKALLVIQQSFNASEYGEPRAKLEEVGATVAVAASTLDELTAYAGEAKVQPDVLLSDVHAADYDVVVFVGGYPYSPDDSEMHRIAQEAVAESKLVAGICNGVITLARAGVLEGKQVTTLVYHPAAELEEGGAILVSGAVVRDGLIITGDGPSASREFAEAIVAALDAD